MKALACPALFHGAIESAFSGERQHPLWRIDTLGGKTCLLILSEAQPELSSAQQQFGLPEEPPMTKDYSALLNRTANGSIWQFRLTANPTYSKPNPNGRGTVCAHITPQNQLKWLLCQAEKHGFSLIGDSAQFSQSKWYQFYKGTDGNRKITLLSVTFDGILQITDEMKFREMLVKGIGREKAYGMGLMTLVRCHE